MLRQFPADARAGVVAMISAQYGLLQKGREIEKLPPEERESAALDAFAQYLLAQGIHAKIDEAGSPVLEGPGLEAILQTLEGEGTARLLAGTILRLQALQE
jgi:hypothetical protein